MLIRHWRCRGKSALPGFFFGIKPEFGCRSAQLLWLALASLALFQPITVAVHFEDVDVVGEAIQQGAGEPLRAKHAGRR